MSRGTLAGLVALALAAAWGGVPAGAGEADLYRDCGNGTVADPAKGLLWEQKQDSGAGPDLSRPHETQNTYTWTAAPVEPTTRRVKKPKSGKQPATEPPIKAPAEPLRVEPNGTLFTEFLARLNQPDPETGQCFAGHCDWRIPTMYELELLRVNNCRGLPCSDPIFGPSATSRYWSEKTNEQRPEFAWASKFFRGTHNSARKTTPLHARAVRNGNCDH